MSLMTTTAVAAKRLTATVDDQIAATDPQFAAYLRDYRAALASGKVDAAGALTYSFPQDEDRYIRNARAQYWRNEASKVQITLSDPSLKSKCHLP